MTLSFRWVSWKSWAFWRKPFWNINMQQFENLHTIWMDMFMIQNSIMTLFESVTFKSCNLFLNLPHHLLLLFASLVHPLLLFLVTFLLLPPLVLQHLLMKGAWWRFVVLAQETLDVVCQLVNHHLGRKINMLNQSVYLHGGGGGVCPCVCSHLSTSYCRQLGEFTLQVLEVFVWQTFGIFQLQLWRPVDFPRTEVTMTCGKLLDDIYNSTHYIFVLTVHVIHQEYEAAMKSHSLKAKREESHSFFPVMWYHVFCFSFL